jgi:hypothetical protein
MTNHVNLRKANAIQEELTSTISDRSDSPDTTLNVMVHDDWQNRLNDMKNQYLDYVGKNQNLLLLRQQLRKLISKKNQEVGVNDLLAEIKTCELQIQFLNMTVTRLRVREMDSVIQKKIDRKLQEIQKSERGYGFDPDYEVSIWTQEDVSMLKNWIKEQKRFKQKLQDKLLELNVSTVIELPEDMDRELLVLGLL